MRINRILKTLSVFMIILTVCTSASAFAAESFTARATLKNDVTVSSINQGGADTYSYYKLVSPGTGFYDIEIIPTDGVSPVYINVYSKGKNKLISNDIQLTENSAKIGVGKATYYVAVKTSASAFSITARFTAVSDKSGSTKAKARTLYSGSTRKGIVSVGQSASKGDWYKFTLKEPREVKILFDTSVCAPVAKSGIKAFVYLESDPLSTPSIIRRFSPVSTSYTMWPATYDCDPMLGAGTYYIRMMKYSGGNGYYDITLY